MTSLVIPVSYTHLDVYKRQALFLSSLLLRVSGHVSQPPVSYTHLDVYKRQAHLGFVHAPKFKHFSVEYV